MWKNIQRKNTSEKAKQFEKAQCQGMRCAQGKLAIEEACQENKGQI